MERRNLIKRIQTFIHKDINGGPDHAQQEHVIQPAEHGELNYEAPDVENSTYYNPFAGAAEDVALGVLTNMITKSDEESSQGTSS
jgi:hypothetical protein